MAAKIKVLIVDDVVATRENIKKLMEFHPEFEAVGQAGTGEEALAQAKILNPDVILMDINMPVMDGYEATQKIRKYSAKVPIIAVTAFAYASDEQRVMENGFDGYMPKPINARQLKAQITEIMQKRIILL